MEFFSGEGHWSSRIGYRSPLHHLSRDYLIHECEPLGSGHRHCWDPGVISEAIDQRSSRASRDHLCIHRDHRPRAGGLRMWSGGEWSGDKHQMQFAKKLVNLFIIKISLSSWNLVILTLKRYEVPALYCLVAKKQHFWHRFAIPPN